jgi:hypothetical protein
MTLFKPKPLPDESLYSFLYRFAKGNYLNDVNSLTGLQISNNLNYYVDNFTFHKIEQLVGEKTILNNLVLNKYNNIFLGKNQTDSRILTADHYLKNSTRFCPYCLKEKKYHRLTWDIRIITVCDKHKVYLINECPDCGTKLKIKNLVIKQCVCGIQYSEIQPKVVSNKNIIESQKLIFDTLVNSSPVIDNKSKEIPPDMFFKALYSISNVLHGVEGTGRIFEDYYLGKVRPQFRYSEKLNDRIYEISVLSCLASQIMIQQDEGLIDYLFSICDQKKVNSKKHLKILLEVDDGIKEQYIKHMFNHKTELFSHSFLDTPHIQKYKYMTLNEAVSYLGISYNYIKKLASSGELPYELRKYREKDTMVFNKSILSNWKELYNDLLSLTDIRVLMQVGMISITDLIDHQLLCPYSIPSEVKFNKYLFKKSEITNLLTKLKCNFSVVKEIDSTVISISELYRRSRLKLSYIFSFIEKNNVATFSYQNEVTSLKQIYICIDWIGKIKTSFCEEVHTYQLKEGVIL